MYTNPDEGDSTEAIDVSGKLVYIPAAPWFGEQVELVDLRRELIARDKRPDERGQNQDRPGTGRPPAREPAEAATR